MLTMLKSGVCRLLVSVDCRVWMCCRFQVSDRSDIRNSRFQRLAEVHACKDSQRGRQQHHVPGTGLSAGNHHTPLFTFTLPYTSGSQAFQTTGQKQYLGKFVGSFRKIRLSYPTLLLWVAVQNTNMVKIKYARPKILAGHLVGSRGPKMTRGPQFGNHCHTPLTVACHVA